MSRNTTKKEENSDSQESEESEEEDSDDDDIQDTGKKAVSKESKTQNKSDEDKLPRTDWAVCIFTVILMFLVLFFRLLGLF